ncbi:MAG: PilZ domain-containing protein [Planctomycetia bacterium]|nr:PilZ domain-containing protein [Planctomycetia bacterium]
MDADRRTTFRASIIDSREGFLVARRGHLRVRIVDESAGGLCVATNRAFTFSDGTELRLRTDDGDDLAVRIVYHRAERKRTLIGLERIAELPLQKRPNSGTRPLILLVGLTLGLYSGFALRTETIRERLPQIPTFSQFVFPGE